MGVRMRGVNGRSARGVTRLERSGLSMVIRIVSVWGLACCVVSARAADSATAKEGVEFFEKNIRPVLVERCYKCHSEGDKVKGKLRLDTREGVLKGGENG